MNTEEVKVELREIRDELKTINITLALQHKSLEEHMRRTELTEKAVETLKLELKPIQKHIITVEGSFKVIGGIGFLLGATLTILEIMKLAAH